MILYHVYIVLGLYKKTQAYRHAKNCHFKITAFGKDNHRIVSQGKSLLHKMTKHDNSSNDEWQEKKLKLGRMMLASTS